MLQSTLDQSQFVSNPVNESIARWLMSKGWKPAELAPNWWAELDQQDDYFEEVIQNDSNCFRS